MPHDRTARDRRRRGDRRPADPAFARRLGAALWVVAPRLMVMSGLLAAVVTLLALPSAVRAVDENTALHRSGVATTAEVVSVRKEHHSGRHSSWDEYTPEIRVTALGQEATTELRDYTTRDAERYHGGQHLAVLVDRHDPTVVVPAAADARRGVTRHLYATLALAVVGAVFLAVGVPVSVVRYRADPDRQRWRKRRRRR